MRVSISVLVLCIVLGVALSFQPRNSASVRISGGTSLSSYADQLRRAKEARSGGGAGQTGGEAAIYQPPAPIPQTNAASQQAQQHSDAPFSDDVYEHLSFVIGRLSSRMKNSESMSGEDVNNFMRSVDAIIADMQPSGTAAAPAKDGAPSGYVGATEPLKKGFYIPEPGEQETRPITDADPSSPFAPLHGMKNTWQVKDMERMSTDEYYQEIYRRNREMKDRRMQEDGYSREAAHDYFDSINKKNRSSL